MKFKQTKSNAREILWIAIGAMTLFTGTHKTIYQSFSESWYFFAFTIISLLMFLLWRNRRINNK